MGEVESDRDGVLVTCHDVTHVAMRRPVTYCPVQRRHLRTELYKTVHQECQLRGCWSNQENM